jgi:hypothetical protein
MWKVVSSSFHNLQRWLDNVEADIKALGVKRRRIKAQDRKEWSAILMEGHEAREEDIIQLDLNVSSSELTT